MPIDDETKKALEVVEPGLKQVLEVLLQNPSNSFSSQQTIDITHKNVHGENMAVATLYLGNKYAQFHDEFDQTAYTIPELRQLVDYLITSGWDVNLS